ncbi:MAG: sensor histidine kinase N-terminal domain-containing protein, partial [Methylococcaceae bacterium]
MHKKRSLKTEMLFRLVIPLIFFVIIDAVLSYFVTLHYVDEAYDRWLLDSARSLAQGVKV